MSAQPDGPRALSLEELQGWIGREHGFAGADEVSRSDIRRKLEVYCFDCPLHYDDEVARAATIIAGAFPSPLQGRGSG